ncbi:LPXTG cell wall anchor domain-containing protein [Listeria monocytogenes]|nr:LPXTG cell wall anchor domain-containing protein [Listeria monocytogenes]EAF5405547.1 LPXTG cell wall anchor domain-containing protein [Listeria monocytogenes]EAG4727457.1 LPXTG cell wall anchor domain-containing protein [Listeria monocytogenes]EAG5553994.1 LPXTG cell wall anchor domain-containing protein [Listeria monocytogenes]ECC0367841.1 LPXTG cell wall anchor domain-containing protein [Listeria monocytogenes]
MKDKKYLQRLFVALTLLIGFTIWIGTRGEIEAQAESLTQPTSINQIFPDYETAKVIQSALQKTNVTDTVTQEELNTLTLFYAYGKGIESIDGLQYLNNLEVMLVGANKIHDYRPLSGLSKLQEMDLSDNEISDISSLSKLTSLTRLNLYNNQISDIDALSELTNLQSLWIGINQISNINVLSNLTNLTQTNLDDNQISDINPLSGLKKLTFLRAARNHISDISVLEGLTNLSDFYMADQKINNEAVNYETKLHIQNKIKDNTGALISPQTISDSGSYTNPTINWNLPDYQNQVSYTFNQWVTFSNAMGPFSGKVTQPLKETPLVYNVFFDIDGVETSEQVEMNTLLPVPTVPEKEGYTSTGWYDAPTGGNQWDFEVDKMPAKDFTLYAQFSINQYIATLDVDGKTSSQTIAYQKLVQEPAEPKKEGYTFIGWYDEKTGGTEWDFATDKMPAKDITLYAQFSKNSSDEGTPGDKGHDEVTGGKGGTTDKPTDSDLQPIDKPTNNSPQLEDTQSSLSVKAKHESGSKEQGAKEKSSLPATGDGSSVTLYLQAIGVLFLVAFFWISLKRKKVRNEK